MVLAVGHQRHGHTHPEPRRAPPFGEPFEGEQEQRRGHHQRTVGHGDKTVQLQHERRGREHDEKPRIAAVGTGGPDDAPEDKEVKRLQQGKEKPHAELSAEEMLPKPDQQRRHRRMVEIAPRDVFGEHMVVGLVIGQLRETGLKEVANPPYTQPERDQGVGTERSVYLFDGCSHTAAKVAKFIGFAPPGPQREVHADSFCEKSPHEGGRGIFFPRRPTAAVLFTICSLIGAPNDCRLGNNLYICSRSRFPAGGCRLGIKRELLCKSGTIPVAVSSVALRTLSEPLSVGREGVRKERVRRPA